MHEEAFIGTSPSIIKFDVGQILGDPADLRPGVLRVTWYDAHAAIQG